MAHKPGRHRSDPSDRNMTNKKRGGQGGKGQGPHFTDIASDPSFSWRLLKTNLSAFANDLGKLGYEVTMIHEVLDKMEETLGTRLTGFAINTLAALIQQPKFLKDWVRLMGWPEQINELADEFIDDMFEGLRMAMREDDTKIDEREAKKAMAVTREAAIKRAAEMRFKTFVGAKRALKETDRKFVDALVDEFKDKPERLEEFQSYHPKLSEQGVLEDFVNYVRPRNQHVDTALWYCGSQLQGKKTMKIAEKATTLIEKGGEVGKKLLGRLPPLKPEAQREAEHVEHMKEIERRRLRFNPNFKPKYLTPAEIAQAKKN